MERKKVICAFGFIASVAVVAIITWFVEDVIPARDLYVVSTPVPEEHFFYTLPYQESKHRLSFVNNTFIQMLHHTHTATNETNCWICGMMPAHQKKGGTPFIPLPFSHNGSCRAWYTLLFATRKPAVGRLLFRLNKECHQNKEGYPQANGTIWEWEEYRPDNESTPYIFTNTRDTVESEKFVISVAQAQADLCVQSVGYIPVGVSDCIKVLNIDGLNNSTFLASHNTYFVCGNRGYYRLPAGWSGVCYVSFLLPPVFLAPATYHKDLKLLNNATVNRYKRTLSIDDVDQTDTSLQQYVDFNLGLFFFVGAALNSRKIRRLTRVVEAVTNQTAAALGNVTEELQITRIVALQNRMVLDVILAEKGGACRLIGSSCCVFIPDNSPYVYNAINKLHKIAADIHVDNERAHRALLAKSLVGARPRPVIARFLNFADRDVILREARKLGEIRVENSQIMIFPDYSQEVQKMRRSFDAVKAKLRDLKIQYMLLFPAKLKVIYKEKTYFLTHPEDAWQWLEERPPLRRREEGEWDATVTGATPGNQWETVKARRTRRTRATGKMQTTPYPSQTRTPRRQQNPGSPQQDSQAGSRFRSLASQDRSEGEEDTGGITSGSDEAEVRSLHPLVAAINEMERDATKEGTHNQGESKDLNT
ncbi:uncharacterized protein LOC144820215 [Lissotriton helveticus]